MATLDLPLPEITVEDFNRAWTRFELVAKAKEWSADRQKLVLPTLLRGKLVEFYVEANEETRGELARLKAFLLAKSGLARDPLTSSQLFISRSQNPGEKVSDFVVALKTLFKEAYETEETTSAILLQRFLTGLLPPIRRQLLLKGKPTTLVQAVRDAEGVEYALNFATESDSTQDEIVSVVHQKRPAQESVSDKFQESLDQIVKRLEALETTKKCQPPSQQSFKFYSDGPPRNDRDRNRGRGRGRGRGFDKQRSDYEQCCWLCGEIGHLKRQCPLNYKWPARRMDGWPHP